MIVENLSFAGKKKQLRQQTTMQQNVRPGMADKKNNPPFLDLIALSLFCPGGIEKR